MRSILVLLVILFFTAPATAKVGEIVLPAGATRPLAVAFDDDGRLWTTLDGSWAVGRLDPVSGAFEMAVLQVPKQGGNDSLWSVRFGPDGSAWSGSGTHLHRVDPESMQVESFAIPTPTALPGDVYVRADGVVWYAALAADRLVRFDPGSGDLREVETPATPFGPLMFDETPWGVYLTATYADTFAAFDPETGELTVGKGRVVSPVGLADDGTSLWIAEMGGSSIARVDPTTNEVQRFPTSPPHNFPISGPAGILVAGDGSVWFAEHFADRIARLDPETRTLHEYEIPSGPYANAQHVAEAPDGKVWFAEWSRDRIGWVEHEPFPFPLELPETIDVKKGLETVVRGVPNGVVFGTGESGLTAAWS